MKVLIGHTGLIGGYLLDNLNFDCTYNSANLQDLSKILHHETIYCAAPSGNRRVAMQTPEEDRKRVDTIIKELSKVEANRVILISTVDSQLSMITSYGRNRLVLENFVKDKFPCYHILRLGSLIHSTIKKNLLYDLKNDKWISLINANDKIQWYPLINLTADIQHCIDHSISELNLVSEPICNVDIVARFVPRYLDKISKNKSFVNYNFMPYRFSKEEILRHIGQYLK